MAEKSGARVLVVGGGVREAVMAEALSKDSSVTVLNYSSTLNPSISRITGFNTELGDECDGVLVSRWAKEKGVDLAVIGPEGPLKGQVTDYLLSTRIDVASPTFAAAQVELSKVFLRNLMRDEKIPGGVDYQYFLDAGKAERFLKLKKNRGKQFVLKPDGLTRGMGVKVMGSHLDSTDAAISYANDVLDQRIWGKMGLLIEDKIEGQEFTLQAFVSGEGVLPLQPIFRDFKFSEEGDQGSFCGSMGGYSRKDGLLDFLTRTDLIRSTRILEQIARALVRRNTPFVGTIYGQFMKTLKGEIKVTELNARGGEPDIVPPLKMLRNRYVSALRSMVNGTIASFPLGFDLESSVLRYLVPNGYPDNPQVESVITVDEDKVRDLGVDLIFARVKPIERGYLTTSSRSLALYAQGEDAALRIDQATGYVKGPVRSRKDIGLII